MNDALTFEKVTGHKIDEWPRKATMYKEPWPYIVIDNFLPRGEFMTMMENCMFLHSGNPEKFDRDYDDQVIRIPLKWDPLEEHNMHLHLASFTERRNFSSVKDLKVLSHYVRTKANFNHKRHDEAPFKILSTVLYLAPDGNNGTRLYTSETSNDKLELEWKPNRAVIFAGRDNVTWHDYTSSWNDRYTLNHFLVDPSVVENEKIKESLI